MIVVVIYILVIIVLALVKKVDVVESFTKGVKSSYPIIKNLLPSIMFFLLGVNIFLHSGIIELLCIMPLGLINESISTDWKYDPDSVDKTTKQIKSILWTSIIGVGISAIMCGYPFILPYKESTLVIILTALIIFFNLVCLHELIRTLKNVEIKIKENIQRFAEEK